MFELKAFCELPEDYRPSESEPFMSDQQREYFRRRLVAWRDTLVQHSLDALEHLKNDSLHEADEADQAVQEEEFFETLSLRNRESKLLVKIDEALERLEKGTYGFCLETGEPINLKRLEIRLVATHSVEAKNRQEMGRHLRGSATEVAGAMPEMTDHL